MATRSLNKVMLIGNLTRDPELRYTPQGTAVCTFGLATNRSWQTTDGQSQEEVEFHRIVSWQKLAELCAQLLFKGRKTFVEGRLQTRTWTGRDNQERTTTEVVIDNMIVLDAKRRPEEGMETGEASAPAKSDQPEAGDKPVKVENKETKIEPKKAVEKKPAAAKATETKSRGGARGASTGTSGEEVKADDIPF
jgi:single-strand DNA-binding protein